MDWSVEIGTVGEVVVATANGRLGIEAYLSIREKIRLQLEAVHARRVLLDLRSAVLHVSTAEVFDAAASNPVVIPRWTKYAIVVSPETISALDAGFGENVACNRGAQLRSFTDISLANRWLADEHDTD